MIKWNEFNPTYTRTEWHISPENKYIYSTWYSKNAIPIDSFLVDAHQKIVIKHKNNKELLKKAKTVYVHPACKFPRGTFKGRLKKCNDPILADIIILPNTKYGTFGAIIFECPENKAYAVISLWWDDQESKVKEFVLSKGGDGVLLSDVVNHFVVPHDSNKRAHFNETICCPENYKCVYIGPVVNFDNKDTLLLNYVNGLYQEDKIFSEDFFTKYLSQENTSADITYDMVISLHEMLQSNDGDTNSAALKTLASLNYLEYPNTVKYILQNTWYSWRYNNAKNTTSVKYMRKALDIPNRGYYCNSFFGDISQKDYDLFTRVFYTIEKYTDMGKCLQRMVNLNFMRCNAEGKIVPNLKDEN